MSVRMNTPRSGWLALDQGGHASRAFLFDENGRIVGDAEVAITTRSPAGDRVEHDAIELVSSIDGAARRVLAERPDVRPIAAGLATQRSSIVCWNRRTLEPLSPVLSWQDRRNAAWLETLQPDAQAIRDITGLPLSPHYGASKMRWCLDELSAVRDAAQSGELVMGPLATFIASRLVGRTVAADPANASRTLLYDVRRGAWSKDMLARFELHESWLPECGSTSASLGRVADLHVDLSVVTGDQSAVPYAWGAPDRETLFVNLGTGGFLQRYAGTEPPDAGALLASVLGGADGTLAYSLEGTLNGAGSAVDAFLMQERLDADVTWTLFERSPTPRADDPVFVNAVGGLGSPWWRSHAQTSFVGEGAADARFRAVVESIAFLIRANAEQMRGTPIERVVLSGGLARSDGVAQMCADVLGVTVLRPSLSEATVHGVLQLLSGLRADANPEIDARAFKPRAAANGASAEREARYARWSEAIDRA